MKNKSTPKKIKVVEDGKEIKIADLIGAITGWGGRRVGMTIQREGDEEREMRAD